MNAFKKTPAANTASPAHKSDTLNDRLSAAGQAKQAMLDRFRSRPAATDPAVLERQAAQIATEQARDARAADRKAVRDAEAERQAELRAAQEVEAAAQEAALAAQAAEAAVRAADLKVEQKAARDARYAARQARRK